MAIDMRKQARASVAINSIPDEAIEAAQEAFHEFAFGLDEPLTKREKGITRLAYRAAIHAALEAMSDDANWEYGVRGHFKTTGRFWGEWECNDIEAAQKEVKLLRMQEITEADVPDFDPDTEVVWKVIRRTAPGKPGEWEDYDG